MDELLTAQKLREMVEQWTQEHNGWEPDRAYLGMSQVWRCPALLYDWLKKGRGALPFIASLLCYEGYLHERDMVGRLEGLGVYGSGRELVAAWDERFMGHTDGELLSDGTARLLEIKSVRGRDFEFVQKKRAARERDYQQVQMYLLYGGYREGMIVYKNRESGEVWPVFVEFDQEKARELEAKAKAVLAAVDAGERPACECGRH